MKNRLIVIFLSFILASCAAKLPYASNYPLTNEVFHSRDGIIAGRIPQGWYSATDDTLAPALVVWLMKDDFSAVLTVREIKLDRLTSQRVEKNGLKLLANISAGFRVAEISGMEIDPQEFSVNGKKYCSYEIVNGSDHKRIVVFPAGEKHYECEAYLLKSKGIMSEYSRLFTIQQTVLSSLIY